MSDPLQFWKAKTARQTNALNKMKAQVVEYHPCFAFPATKAELNVFVRTKKAALVGLRTTLQGQVQTLHGYLEEGLTLVHAVKDDEKRQAAETQYTEYMNQVLDLQDSVDEWFEIIVIRLAELEEQARDLNQSTTLIASPAAAGNASSATQPQNQRQATSRRTPAAVDRTSSAEAAPGDLNDSARADGRQQLIDADEDELSDQGSQRSWGGAPRNRPKQQLPKFAGNLRKFASFWSAYSSMVHEAEDLTDLDKFFYLRQALKEDALKLIEEIPVTERNYGKAVQLLKDRYDLGANMTSLMISDIQKMRTATPTSKSIRETLETLRQKVITLDCHGEEFLDHQVWRSIILSKFPNNVCSHIIKDERRQPKNEDGSFAIFTVKEMLYKISDYVQLLECVELNSEAHRDTLPGSPAGVQSHRQDNNHKKNFKEKFEKKNGRKRTCLCSSDAHRLQDCPTFASPGSRRDEAKRLGVCWKCFERGHMSKDCPRLGPCPKCNGPHHSALCTAADGPSSARSFSNSDKNKSKPSSGAQTNFYSKDHKTGSNGPAPTLFVTDPLRVEQGPPDQVILMHVTGQLFNEASKTFGTVNVFIDDGAAISLIKTSVSDSFGLKTKGPFSTKVSGVGGHIVDLPHHLAQANIRAPVFGEPDRILELKTIPEICQPLQTAELSSEDWEKIKSLGICLNRGDYPTATVDILIGQDFRQYFVYEEEPRIRLPSGLLLTKTVFGYAVTGCSSSKEEVRPSVKLRRPARATVPEGAAPLVGVYSSAEESALVVNTSLPDPVRLDLQKDLSDLYSLENLGIRTDKDANEMKVINFMEDYRKTIQFKDGEVEAGFPFLESIDRLKDNFNVAVKQLQHQLRDLQKRPEHLSLYEDTFSDYLRQGFIEQVPLDGEKGLATFYLPHHPVICPEKSTSFRVVFNASSHSRGDLSLNDVIFPGYSITALIYEVLLQFRSYDYAMIADIQKAFLQIRLPEAHRDVTRFLWVNDKTKPATGSNLKVFRFCRVPFGINASPAILNQVILKHLELVNTSTSKEIAASIYVDNVQIGANEESELIEKYHDSKDIFKKIGMRLRDYLSNSTTVNDAIADEDRAKALSVKVLGIQWSTAEDTLSLSLTKKPSSKKVTTRTVLSQVNGFCYDPLGLMSPFLLNAKVFLQGLHKKKRGWDDCLDEEEVLEWNAIVEEIAGTTISVPRRVSQLAGVVSRKLMVFSDSSQKAYGCAAYVVTTTSSGQTYSRLYSAKMKITPLKELTIPRLELTGIFIAANMALTILNDSGLKFDEVNFFGDSSIAISWIKSARLLPPFVKELTAKIQKTFERISSFVPTEIYHVRTHENVADIATRGLTKEVSADHVWWTGPLWITKEKSYWPITEEITATIANIACFSQVATVATAADGKRSFDVEGGIWPVARISSLKKLQRITAYTLRFIKHISRGRQMNVVVCPENHSDLTISGHEMKVAERHLLLQEQKKTDLLAMQRECNQLNLQFDKHGLLRKHSRLNKSGLAYDHANPIFVPSKSALSTLIIRHLHNINFHRKGAHLQSLVQERFWIPKLKATCDKIGKSCVSCSVYGRAYKYPLLADLPPERVQKAAPFAFTGTDLFGPLIVKNSNGSEEKRWIALFTCFVTRMVHLEIVRDQSARAYLLALRRFIGRRGVPQRIWSDNGTNFTLSWKLLQAQQKCLEQPPEDLLSFVAAHHIQWSFIPPGAPWMGGTWERMVGLVKKPLLQAIGRRRVDEDLLHSLLCGVEATVNSRPLYCSTNEDEEPEVLRPIDFVQPQLRLCSPPFGSTDEDDPEYLPVPLVKSHSLAKKAIQDIESALDRFWKKFHSDYLLSLKGIFNKSYMDYAASARTPKIGDIVLLDDDDHTPRHLWLRGRVHSITPSKDGAVRSVVVRLSNGSTLHRPVNKLIPLEIPSEVEAPVEGPENQENAPAADHPEVRRQPPRKAKKPVNYVENGLVVPSRALNFATLLPVLLATSMLPLASAAPYSVVSCINGGLNLKFDRVTFTMPVTSEICINGRECTTLVSTTDQSFYLSPRQAIVDYTVQWRTLQGTRQLLETVTCSGTPNCALIDCYLCPELLGNPHCWPQAAIFATVFWIYLFLGTVLLIWKCCCRRRIRSFCDRKLTSIGNRFLRTARRNCRQRKSSENEDEEEQLIPLVRVETLRRTGRVPQSPIVNVVHIVALAICIGLLPGTESCQRVSVIESSLQECSSEINGSCVQLHTTTASMSELRREFCIRTTQDNAIRHQLRLHLESITMTCKPVVLFHTRNIQLKTINVKRCAFAGSCTPSFCNSVSSRTEVPELDQHKDLPGYNRCFSSCGGLGCGCLLAVPGCLYSRTVAELQDSDVYEVVKCPSWNVQARIRTEELLPNGTHREYLLAVRQQTTLDIGIANITVDFVSSPPLPILSSVFVRRTVENGTKQSSTGLLVPLHTEIALQCQSTEDALNPGRCFLANTCLCSPSSTESHCDCKTLNITQGLESLQTRLPVTSPDVAISMKNGIISATSHHSVAEITVTTRQEFNKLVIDSTRCSVKATPVEGCYNCLRGSSTNITCTSTTPTIATLRCQEQDFAIPCNSTGKETRVWILSSSANYDDSCSVSCSPTNISLSGVLTYSSLWTDNLSPEQKGHYINFIHWPDVSRILDVAVTWWKTSLLVVLLLAAAVGIVILLGPMLIQRTLLCLMSKPKRL